MSVDRPERSLAGLALLGVLVAAPLLAVVAAFATAGSWPQLRDPQVETMALVLVYPLAVWLVYRYARSRCPSRATLLTGLFCVAFCLRVVLYCLSNLYTAAYFPQDQGYPSDDTVWHAIQTRLYVMYLTGRDYGAMKDAQEFDLSGRVLSIENVVGLRQPHFTWVAAALTIVLGGWSLLAVNMPHMLLGSFLAVQVYVILRHVCRPRTALLVMLAVAFGPDQLYESMCLHKDIPTAVGLAYIMETWLLHRRDFGFWHLAKAVLVAGLLWCVRDVSSHFAVLLYGYGFARYRFPQVARQLDVSLVTLAILAAWYAGEPASFFPTGQLAHYPIAYVGNVLLVPSLYWLSAPIYTLSVMNIGIWPMAVAWPVVGGLLVVGVLLHRRGLMRFDGYLLVCCLLYLAALTEATRVIITAIRWRVPIYPFILAYAIEALWTAQAQPGPVRRRLYGLVAGYAVAIVTANVAFALLRGQ